MSSLQKIGPKTLKISQSQRKSTGDYPNMSSPTLNTTKIETGTLRKQRRRSENIKVCTAANVVETSTLSTFCSVIPGVNMELVKKVWELALTSQSDTDFPRTRCMDIFYKSFFKLCPESKSIFTDHKQKMKVFSGMISTILKLDTLFDKNTNYTTKLIIRKEYPNPSTYSEFKNSNSNFKKNLSPSLSEKFTHRVNSLATSTSVLSSSPSSPSTPSSNLFSPSIPFEASTHANTILTLEQALEVPMHADSDQEDQERNLYTANTFSFTSVIKSQSTDQQNASYTTVDINPANAISAEGYETLRALGKNHVRLGVTSKMYTAISYAILSVLKHRLTKKQYTQEAKNAWTKAIRITTDVMQGKVSLARGKKLKKTLSITKSRTLRRKPSKKSAEHQQFSPESLHSDFLTNLVRLQTKSASLSDLKSLSKEFDHDDSSKTSASNNPRNLQSKLTRNRSGQMTFTNANTRNSMIITNFDGLLSSSSPFLPQIDNSEISGFKVLVNCYFDMCQEK
eukprot:Awhi_evm1s13523